MSVSSVIEYSLIDYQIVASGLCCDNLGLSPYIHTHEIRSGRESDDVSCQAWGQQFSSLSSPPFWKSAEHKVIPRAVS